MGAAERIAARGAEEAPGSPCHVGQSLSRGRRLQPLVERAELDVPGHAPERERQYRICRQARLAVR
jgi:hypothetical protein